MPIGSNVADKPVPTTPSYCTIAEVADILNQPAPSEAADEGDPTLTQWNNRILRMEEQIDRSIRTSFRVRQILLEYHPFNTWIGEQGHFLVQLQRSPAKTLSAGSGDSLELWNGGSWEDWLATRTEGRNADYWLEEPFGYLRVRRSTILVLQGEPALRVSYRYGSTQVPADISHACALLTAVSLATPGRIIRGGKGTSDRMSVGDQVLDWRREAYNILSQYQGPGRGY